MARLTLTRFALAIATFIGGAAAAAAGQISVFTEIYQAGTIPNNNEIPVTGIGTFAVLTNGGGVNPVLTVAADQSSAHQLVVGFWPVIGFQNQAQYNAQSSLVVPIPATPVTLYTEVWNGAYGQASQVERVFFDATVSGHISPTAGQNEVDWDFIQDSKDVHFGDTTVTVSYQPVRMSDGVPLIQYDGAPPPGPIYYPTLLEATVDVTRPATDPGAGNADDPGGAWPGQLGRPGPAAGAGAGERHAAGRLRTGRPRRPPPGGWHSAASVVPADRCAKRNGVIVARRNRTKSRLPSVSPP